MKHTILFLPSGKKISVTEGTLISVAAIMAELTELHLPCGGKGTCGKCLVELVAEKGSEECERVVPACRTKVNSDMVVRTIGDGSHGAIRIVAGSSLDSSRFTLSPICRYITCKVDPPAIHDNYSDLERLARQIVKKAGPGETTCDIPVLRKLAGVLRQNEGAVGVTVHSHDGLHDIISITADPLKTMYGIACDIGTTTVSLHCIDMTTGRITATRSDCNAQIRRGVDVISRIEYAKTADRLEELRSLILATVNDLIAAACADTGIETGDISCMSIAGNCTMTHLLLGLPPRYIREHPYVPTLNSVPLLKAGDTGLSIRPSAPVLCAPGVGSYVGGDITSGLICTDIIDQAELITLFIDIGTNGEIVIGNREFLMTCACSAGPAFEGSGIGCGMRAGHGAIESFSISDNGKKVEYEVIGAGRPHGICGSGLISLLGELLLSGLIDRSGKFTDKIPVERSTLIEGTKGMILVPPEHSASGKPVIITESDLNNIIRTKAAIYAACDLMIDNAGLTFGSIGRVLIAGGFGRFIDVEDAIRIGLFPDIDRSLFSYLGNTSLAGAALSLLSEQHRKTLKLLPKRMTYIELSNDNRYMDSYIAALFLPHTDLDRFPSCK